MQDQLAEAAWAQKVDELMEGERGRMRTHIVNTGVDKGIFRLVPVEQGIEANSVCGGDPDESGEQALGRIQEEDVHDDSGCSEFGDRREDGGFCRALARRGVGKGQPHEDKLHDSVIVLPGKG